MASNQSIQRLGSYNITQSQPITCINCWLNDLKKCDDWVRIPTEMGPELEDNRITQYSLISILEYLQENVVKDKTKIQQLHKVKFFTGYLPVFYRSCSENSGGHLPSLHCQSFKLGIRISQDGRVREGTRMVQTTCQNSSPQQY